LQKAAHLATARRAGARAAGFSALQSHVKPLFAPKQRKIDPPYSPEDGAKAVYQDRTKIVTGQNRRKAADLSATTDERAEST
jgi:hypothetical protein